MHIISPLDHVDEIRLLARKKVREFYCGYVPPYFVDRVYSSLPNDGYYLSLNRRNSALAQINSLHDLSKMVMVGKKCNCDIYVTLNALYYPDCIYQILDSYIDECASVGIKGFIVTNLELVRLIKEMAPSLEVFLSTCSQITNSYSAKFAKELGADRITFPRHMSLKEIITIVENCPEIDYELFVLDGGCLYDDGHCYISHCCGPICKEVWNEDFEMFERGDIDFSMIRRINQLSSDFHYWTNSYLSQNRMINGWALTKCSLCSLPSLSKYPQIRALKFPGRSISLAEKLKMVRLLCDAICMVENGASREDLIHLSKKTFGLGELCDNGTRCLLNPEVI